MTAKNPYRTGSPQEPGAYIEREADQRLRKELADNRRFPFVFAPPDSGKSSLLRRTLQGLDPGQHCGMLIDLSRLRMVDYTLFTGELLTAIAQAGDFDPREIAADCPEDTFVAWLGTFPQRLIVLLDGGELLAKASFGEQFLGKLKFLLNVRAENEEFGRLQFVLASALPMGRLVPTHLQTPYTPEIVLPPLTPSQVDALAWHLGSAQADVDAHVGAVLYRHTLGVPYLCQHLLAALWDEAAANKSPVTVAQLNQLVDRAVDRAAQNEHLAELFRVISQSPTMIDTFLRLRRGLTVDPQRMQELVSTGLCDYDQPYRCSIYERVYGPGGALDLTRAATQRGTAEPTLTEPPRPPRTSEPLPAPPRTSQPPQVQLLPEPPRPPRTSEPPPPPALRISQPPPLQTLPEPPLPTRPPEPIPAPLRTSQPQVQLLPEPPRPVPTVPVLPPVPVGAMAVSVAEAMRAAAAAPISEFSAEEEQTAVDDAKLKLAGSPEDHGHTLAKPSLDELRTQLEDQLFLSAELDTFCNSYFPAIGKQFKLGMSRTERTNLLLEGADPAAIAERLKEWEVSLERRQEVVAAVVAGSDPLIEITPLPPPRSAISPLATKAPPPPPLSALAEAPSGPAIPPVPPAPPPPPPPTPPPPPPPAAKVSGVVDPSLAETPDPDGAPAFREPTAVLSVGVGLVLANRYFLTSEVGHGAVAMVWNAYDRIKDEQVALKLLHGAAAENPTLVQRFWHSAQQQASLSHPAIVGVLNKPREESGIHYVVMEYVPAGNLRHWVLNSKLTRTQLLRLMQRLGSALQYAHERKVLHRNVKPTNILFDTTGHARLVDFGLQWPADATSEKQSRLDRVIYMAPEEQLGDSDGDPRSDVYSLGMCALFALHGKELPSLVMQERASFIEQLEVPPALKAVVKRAVAMNAADRFSSAAEFCRALEVDAPALPGISVRNSDAARGPERRSSAEDLRTIKAEPSQRMQIPSLTTGNHGIVAPAPAATPPPPPAAARSAAPPPPPPPAAVVVPPVVAAPPPPALPPPRPRPIERDNDEIPPTAGRNPTAAAQYTIATEKVLAVAAPVPVVARVSTPALVPMVAAPPPKASPWRSVVFAMMGLVVVSGSVLAYLLSTMPGTSPGGALVTTPDPSGNTTTAGSGPAERPVVEALNDPGKRNPLTAPVIPLHPAPERGKSPPTATAHNDPPTPVKGDGTKVAMVSPKEQVRGIPTHNDSALTSGKPEKGEGKFDPGAAGKTYAGTTPTAGTKIGAGTPPKPQIATNTPPAAASSPVAPAVKQPSIPIIAAKQQPKTWEVVALNDSGHKSEPTPTPVAGNPPPRVITLPAPPPPRVVTLPATPPRATTPPASSAASSEAETILREAQTAFVRGDRQGAITAALRVTQHGGEEATKAWRFVGGAACSGKLAPQATNAYRNLKDPDHKRLLVELCQRNGLHFENGAFSAPEE